MTSARSQTAVVLSSPSDPGARLIIDALAKYFEVLTPTSMLSSLGRPTALRALLVGAEVVVAVVPRAPNRDRSNVIFELGVAVGTGARVLVVAAKEGMPLSLRGLPAVDSKSPATVVANRALASLASDPYTPEPEDVKLSLPKSDVGRPSTPTSGPSMWQLNERDLVESLAHAFRAAGARVQLPRPETSKSPMEIPDLVLWDDGLQANFDLPLPVEVVRSATSVAKIRARLLRLMDKSGAASLLVVSAASVAPSTWSDGQRFMLIVSADDISARLGKAPLGAAMAELLSEASA